MPAEQQIICEDGDVRLVGGGKKGEGLVEICISNRWGSICGNGDANWSHSEAAVVCRQLGFDPAETSKIIISAFLEVNVSSIILSVAYV